MPPDDALTVGSRAQREDLASRGGRINRAKSRVQAALARHPRIYPAALALHIAYGRAVGRLHELPNAYIVGFQRCGTTALYSYLAQHPDVMAGFAKEARYFEDAARHARGIGWYRSNFALSAQRALHERRTRRRAVIMDASAKYASHPHAMRRIAAVTPEARIVALVRDPIDRAYSHYRMNVVARPDVEEGMTFAQAIEAEESRVAGEYERMERDESYYSTRYFGYAYARGGLYAKMLAPWAERFGERLLVVEAESLRADPQGTVGRVAGFLGLERREVADTRERNVGGGEGIDGDTRSRLAEYYREPNKDLEGLLGRRLAWGKGTG
ncbi:MAG: sulfotransferase [Thaumarchaeota archaeon]|nr:sulfotransferase [Nitrososphaerota archaeon]